MNNNNFEKKIADKLNSFEVQPSADLFDNIMAARTSKAKTVGFGSFKKGILAISALALVSIAVLYFKDSKESLSHVANNEVQASVQFNENEMSGDLSKNSNTNPNKQFNENLESNQMTSFKETAINLPKSNDLKQVAKTRSNGLGLKNAKFIEDAIRENSNKSANSNTNNSNLKNGNKIETTTLFLDDGTNIYERYFANDNKNKPSINSEQHNKNSHLYVYDSEDALLLDKVWFNINMAKWFKKFNFKYSKEEVLMVNYLAKMPKKKQVNIKRKAISMDVFGSAIVSKSHAMNSEQATNLNGLNSISFSQALGARIHFPIKKQWSAFSGLSFLNQNTRFKGTFSEFQQEVKTNDITSYINDPIRGVIPVHTIDTQYLTNNIKHNVDLKNRYTIFQIPIGLTYNVGFGALELGLNGSAVANFTTMSKGKTFKAINLNNEPFNSGKKYFNLGAAFGVAAAYKISPHIKILLEPSIQIFNVSALKANNNINERVFNKQLNIGIRYQLF